VALGLIAVVAVGAMLALSGALPHPGALGTFGMAAALVAALFGGLALHARRTSKLTPEELLGEFSHELALHLPNHMAAEIPTPAPRSFEPRQLSALLPRSVVGIAITLAATTLAALVGSSAARPTSTGQDEASAPAAEPASDEALASLPSPPAPPGSDRAAIAPALSGETVRAPTGSTHLLLGAPCECRQTIPLPSPGAQRPRLTPVVLARRSQVHDGHVHTELELAVVNDGQRDARNVSLSVLFFEERSSPPSGQFQTGERPLHFEGPLSPGHVFRWHVEGRGTSFDVIAPDLGVLADDGSDAAPADAFAELATSGARPLRLHATERLAFVGDGRTQASARALQPATSEAEAAFLDRLLEAPPDVTACAVTGRRDAGQWRFEACLFNGSSEALSGLVVRVHAFDAALDPLRSARVPARIAAHTVPLGLPLLARSGRRLELSAPLPLDAGVTPRAFEIRVDREENLP
jgi:hypothetical protein